MTDIPHGAPFALVVGRFRLELDDQEVRELAAYALGLLIGMWLTGGLRHVH